MNLAVVSVIGGGVISSGRISISSSESRSSCGSRWFGD